MPRPPNPESEADIASRRRLGGFLKKACSFLERTHKSVTSETSRLNTVAKEAITLLWKDADQKLHGVVESQGIGNPKWRRDALTYAGVFGEELGAKERLFDYFSEEKRFLAGLKFLASIFGSLSKVFPVLSAVKEFIDAVLCARDWLPCDPEIITLGDLR
jgi:hypothetical protein